MKNIQGLRNSLTQNYSKIESGEMDLKTGKELANTAGKIINTVKVQLEYNTFLGKPQKIDFFREKRKWILMLHNY